MVRIKFVRIRAIFKTISGKVAPGWRTTFVVAYFVISHGQNRHMLLMELFGVSVKALRGYSKRHPKSTLNFLMLSVGLSRAHTIRNLRYSGFYPRRDSLMEVGLKRIYLIPALKTTLPYDPYESPIKYGAQIYLGSMLFPWTRSFSQYAPVVRCFAGPHVGLVVGIVLVGIDVYYRGYPPYKY